MQAYLVAGGFESSFSSFSLSSVLTLLPGATAWTPIASLPRGLWRAGASIVGGRLRVNGGQDGQRHWEDPLRSEVMIEK